MYKKLYNIKVLQIFILLQPIIDIITSIMINEFNLAISLGMIVRFAFLFYALFYIFKNRDKKIMIYLGIWLLYIIINLIGNFIVKDNFNIITQGILLTKMVYFPLILLFFVLYFKNNKELDNKVFINVALLVGLSLVISYFTKTAYCSYENYENCYTKGVVAWFNSANEYGLILIALLGFTINEFVKKATIKNTIAFFLIVIFLCALGTKTSYMGVIGVLSIYVIYYIISSFIDRKKLKNFKKVLILILVVTTIAISTNKLPISVNLSSNYNRALETAIIEGKSDEDLEKAVQENMLFNGREDFININIFMYKNSSFFNKLFGLTTQENYYDGDIYDHIIERDFHDLVIFYGILGFCVEMLLPIYLLFFIIKGIIKKFSILLNDEVVIFGIVTTVILAGSFIAGHLLFQPAVSLYFAYLIALIYTKIGAFK